HRRSEGVGWHHQSEIGSRVEARAHARGEIDRDSACLELPCAGDLGSSRYAGVIIDRRERPSWLLGSRRKAPEKAGKPKAHAAFVGQRDRRHRYDGGENCPNKASHTCAWNDCWLFHVCPPGDVPVSACRQSPPVKPSLVAAALDRWSRMR